MTHYAAKDYHPNRRVSLASGCVFGCPAPLPPLESQRHTSNRTPHRKQTHEQYQEAAKRGWATRRARHESA